MFTFKEYRKAAYYTVATILILAAVFGGLKILGVFGERVVFKESFQYQEGMRQRVVTLQAQMAEIDAQIIQNPEIAEQLEAQRKVLEIQLRGAAQ